MHLSIISSQYLQGDLHGSHFPFLTTFPSIHKHISPTFVVFQFVGSSSIHRSHLSELEQVLHPTRQGTQAFI